MVSRTPKTKVWDDPIITDLIYKTADIGAYEWYEPVLEHEHTSWARLTNATNDAGATEHNVRCVCGTSNKHAHECTVGFADGSVPYEHDSNEEHSVRVEHDIYYEDQNNSLQACDVQNKTESALTSLCIDMINHCRKVIQDMIVLLLSRMILG